jgi:hypothetical protein
MITSRGGGREKVTNVVNTSVGRNDSRRSNESSKRNGIGMRLNR